ncbi:hypothetical protein Tco_0661329 [Tanacetum coccineum]
MLTGKWTPMNREVTKFNALVNEAKAMSGENDENLMSIELLYQAHEKTNFKHKSAWNFLKGKHKWNNPESTQARQNRNRVTNEEPKLFGDDTLPRPPDMHRIAKSQRSSNSTASSGSNPAMFQEMMQQQMKIERKEIMESMDREINSRVALKDSKRVTEDLKVLQISTDRMDPIDAAIVNAQKARILICFDPEATDSSYNESDDVIITKPCSPRRIICKIVITNLVPPTDNKDAFCGGLNDILDSLVVVSGFSKTIKHV